jgi:hypothetical protein
LKIIPEKLKLVPAWLMNKNRWTRELLALHVLRRRFRQIGWFRSIAEQRPVDGLGLPIPWMTYSALAFLERVIDDRMTVFEFGCGNSTLWWSRRVKRVVACEHDRSWYRKISSMLPQNAELLFRELSPDGGYARVLLGLEERFDIVVIDGRDRVNCARYSIGALKERGVIIWDNSERPSYRDGHEFLENHGFRRLDFSGLGPVNLAEWQTSIFYRDGNCLGI